jgi:hypothetical protein
MGNISDKLNNLKYKLKLQDPKNITVVAITLAVLVLLDSIFILGGQFKNLSRVNSKIVKLKSDLSSFDINLARSRLSKEKNADNLPSKGKKILSENDAAYILQIISDAANKNDVQIIEIKPLKDFKDDSPKQKQNSFGNLAPLGINIDLIGDYHKFGKFLDDLENGQVFFSVSNMIISAQSDEYLKQKIGLGLVTYVKK